MKTTLELPDELVREIKLRALIRDLSFKDEVADLLRLGLQMRDALPALQPVFDPGVGIVTDAQGFPAFRSQPVSRGQNTSLEDAVKLEQRALEAEELPRAGLSS
jgi:plasmid stability protein